MSFVKDTFFGGAEKKAARAQQQNLEQSQQFVRQAAREAEGKATDLFERSTETIGRGLEGAQNILQELTPAQQDLVTQSNMAAQNTLLAGLPQIKNAILGGAPVDLSGLQAQQFSTPTDFLNQPLPNFVPEPVPQQPNIGPITPSLGGPGFSVPNIDFGRFLSGGSGSTLPSFLNRR